MLEKPTAIFSLLCYTPEAFQHKKHVLIFFKNHINKMVSVQYAKGFIGNKTKGIYFKN